MPASLRTSRVGRVTKPAPSISTLLEAENPCQPPSVCLSCPWSACGRVCGMMWPRVAGGWKRGKEGGVVYCCEAILGEKSWHPVAARLCDEVISRICGEIPALAWQNPVKTATTYFCVLWFALQVDSLSRGVMEVPSMFAVSTAAGKTAPHPVLSDNGPKFRWMEGGCGGAADGAAEGRRRGTYGTGMGCWPGGGARFGRRVPWISLRSGSSVSLSNQHSQAKRATLAASHEHRHPLIAQS